MPQVRRQPRLLWSVAAHGCRFACGGNPACDRASRLVDATLLGRGSGPTATHECCAPRCFATVLQTGVLIRLSLCTAPPLLCCRCGGSAPCAVRRSEAPCAGSTCDVSAEVGQPAVLPSRSALACQSRHPPLRQIITMFRWISVRFPSAHRPVLFAPLLPLASLPPMPTAATHHPAGPRLWVLGCPAVQRQVVPASLAVYSPPLH